MSNQQRNLRNRSIPIPPPAPPIKRGRGRPRKVPRDVGVDGGASSVSGGSLAGLDGPSSEREEQRVVGRVRGEEEDEDEYEEDEHEEEDERDENDDDDNDDDNDDDDPRLNDTKGRAFPGVLKSIVSRFPETLTNTLKRSGNRIRDVPKVSNVEALLSRIPAAIISDTWTQEMEDDMRVRFESDPMRVYMARLPIEQNVLPLWRRCCHLRQVFPTDIIGPEHNMEYGVDMVLKKTTRTNPNWSRGFCLALDRLIFSSPCNDNMNLLALFIRYAVACRIDDRRRVPMDDSATGHPFFDVMKEEIELADGSLDLRRIGERAREVWQSRGFATSWEIQVLESLENRYFDEEQIDRDVEVEDDLAPYRVLPTDLYRLQKAFEKLSDLGVPIFTDMETRYKVRCHSRAIGGIPRNLREFNRLRNALMLKDMRLQEQRGLGRTTVVEEEDVDGVGDSDSWEGFSDGNGQDPIPEHDVVDHDVFYDHDGDDDNDLMDKGPIPGLDAKEGEDEKVTEEEMEMLELAPRQTLDDDNVDIKVEPLDEDL
ncbi:hypothetical protein F4824DRAFT_511237 [Ustulina deusta]|nr:hypothetical protein F4824DRAFT_511237 [Ustulina deusta]